MIRILEATQQNLLFNKAQPILFDRERGAVLKNWETVGAAGLRDGSKLLLV